MALPWRPRVLLTSTDPDAGRLIESRSGAISVPFIRKEDLADATLRELLIGR
jgi:hypothetical protein